MPGTQENKQKRPVPFFRLTKIKKKLFLTILYKGTWSVNGLKSLDEEKNGFVATDQLLQMYMRYGEGLDMPGVSDLAPG